VRESATQSRFEALHGQLLTPLVGREGSGWPLAAGQRGSPTTLTQNSSGGYASYCGNESVIPYHGAFDATWMWTMGRMPGSSSSVPAGMMTCVAASSSMGTLDPQTRQKARNVPSEDSNRSTRPAPEVQRKPRPWACKKVPNAAPCTLRHIEQWQWLMNRGGPSSS